MTKNSEKAPRKHKRRVFRRERIEPAPAGPLELDPFQVQAIDSLLAGYDVLVAAPTGTGKTLIAEKLLEQVMSTGKSAVYTSPIKALSNQKFRDFVAEYGKEKVGLITGDLSINEGAPLLVMTTEIFRNWCFANPEMLEHTTHVIFDEVHFLDDPERGTAWEESIIFAPSHMRIVGLSATVPNVREIASWIADIRERPVKVIEERSRAVPLELSWVSVEGELLNEDEAREYIKERNERRKGRWMEPELAGAAGDYEKRGRK